MILVAVQFDKIDAFGIRSPTDIGKITVCGITCVQIDRFLCFGVIDAYRYFMACHACHRVTYIIQFTYACCDVYQWILCYHALIHPVESEQVSLGTPIGTFVDTKFIAVYALAAYDTFSFGGYLTSLSVIGHYVEIVVECIGQVAAHFVPIFIGSLGGTRLVPN